MHASPKSCREKTDFSSYAERERCLMIDNIQTHCACVNTEAIVSDGDKEDKNNRDGMLTLGVFSRTQSPNSKNPKPYNPNPEPECISRLAGMKIRNYFGKFGFFVLVPEQAKARIAKDRSYSPLPSPFTLA